MSNLRALFDHYDRNKDGWLELSEIERMLSNLQKCDQTLKINPQTIQEWIGHVDRNNDRRITYDEFLQALSKHIKVNDANRENLRKQFYSFDISSNGKMNRNEFQNFMRAVYGYMNDPRFQYKDSVADVFFGELDENHDGEISFDEFYLYINGVLRAKRR